ncbi:PP2C family serine/threonine-protein phosphatase [Providencia stuartii]|uniref:PP2C family serine/threonine-protein phosphatase n=1 Tax=Providencia stuartii TaxID=588 RepID=UPI000CE68018|nr:PP2C family serine/threonine-protein phosphatase [Providencia stuartii]AVE41043.1 protein phosphatase 2C domain-containing protein [Providencia stuartii]
MDQNALLIKLLLEHAIRNRNMPISESALVAIYEDKQIAEAIFNILEQIQEKCADIKEQAQFADRLNECQFSDSQLTLLLPYLQSQSQQVTEPVSLEKEPVLKPGQIPAAGNANITKEPVSLPPTANIVIANGRVGLAFNSQVQVLLSNGETATVERVDFSDEIGVTFDAETSMLSGVPTQSGNIKMSVVWSSEGREPCITEGIFIINPDPRSLWQINEPPADSPYPKKHIDHQIISEGPLRIAAASRRGRSHEHAGSFRDDDFYIHHDDKSGWSLMIVADGAGSAKNSREGSRIAVNTFGEYLNGRLSSASDEERAQFMGALTSWDAESTKYIGAYFAKLFHNAAQLTINNIKNEAIHVDQPIKSFSTTLLATASMRVGDELFAASFWMGDGAIAVYGPAGKVRLLGVPDSGEYAGQTRFLDESEINDNDFNRRIGIGKWPEITHLILMTDGVSDPIFETDNGLKDPQRWDDLLEQITPCLESPVEADKKLAEWLNFFSAGNHDDRTIIVAW